MQVFQLANLRRHVGVRQRLEILTADSYHADVDWLNAHFQFAASQQIDWSRDSDVVRGQIDQLSRNEVQTLLSRVGVQPQQRVHVVWAYSDFGITLPMRDVAGHIDEIWFPATDDVFVFDPTDTWCLELHHEGTFSCGRYSPIQC